MARHAKLRHRSLLILQLDWFIRLRWIVALLLIVASAVDLLWSHAAAGVSVATLVLGLSILIYNAALRVALGSIARQEKRRTSLLLLSWVQLLLDFVSLTLLVLWTGGVRSPLLGFFALHMVFASLLLPRRMAYGGAVAAVVILGAGLASRGMLPQSEADRIFAVSQVLILLLVVFLANRITRELRHDHRLLRRSNRRIRAMAKQVRRQQNAMIQHEKMVALGQMAAGVTHEIANPLASMDSVLQLAERKPEKLGPQLVTTLRQQVARITQIIQQMKAFAHPSDSQMQTVELNTVIEQAIEILHFDKRLNDVTLQQQLAPDAGTVQVFAQGLQQVLVNLIVNALDAMAGAQQRLLVIRTLRRDSYCIIEISDTGHGIRPEHMERLFEPFFTTKPVGKGTGLGLSISYSLVRRQGGHIAATSHPGKGTTFTIRLPARRHPPSQNREIPPHEIARSGKTGT